MCIPNPFVVLFLKFYFTDSTIDLKASGWFIAKSANTLRFKPMFLECTLPINCEYDNP